MEANGRYPVVTSVERGGAVDVSSDEGGLLFPHSVVPHPSDATLHVGETKGERKCWGTGVRMVGHGAKARTKKQNAIVTEGGSE